MLRDRQFTDKGGSAPRNITAMIGPKQPEIHTVNSNTNENCADFCIYNSHHPGKWPEMGNKITNKHIQLGDQHE